MLTALIPARGGSKGIPRKNTVDVAGHPLIAYTIVACKRCRNIDKVVVSTEDEEIAEISKAYGAEVLQRPAELAQDGSDDIGYLGHFFENVGGDEVALMRPTTPLRSPEFIDETIELYFHNKKEITGLRSINATTEIPYKVYRIENNLCKGFFNDFNGITDYSNLPRQVFPQTYQANGHIDIVKKETVDRNSTYGNKIYGMIGDKIIDIDLLWDLEIARQQAKQCEYVKNYF